MVSVEVLFRELSIKCYLGKRWFRIGLELCLRKVLDGQILYRELWIKEVSLGIVSLVQMLGSGKNGQSSTTTLRKWPSCQCENFCERFFLFERERKT